MKYNLHNFQCSENSEWLKNWFMTVPEHQRRMYADHQAPTNTDACAQVAALQANSSKQCWILLPKTKRQTWKIAQSTIIRVGDVGKLWKLLWDVANSGIFITWTLVQLLWHLLPHCSLESNFLSRADSEHAPLNKLNLWQSCHNL